MKKSGIQIIHIPSYVNPSKCLNSAYVPGIMTLSLKDAETHMVYNSIPLTHELRFYELERIKKITDPSIKNQINN